MGTSPTGQPGALGTFVGPRVVLVPVKAFAGGKERLGGALSDDERVALVRRMAGQVLEAARPLPVAVVCDDNEVAAWARDRGALVVWEPGRGLNGAVEEGVRRLAAMGTEQVIVAHADLPWATSFSAVDAFDGVTLVPDRREDGTNVIAIPTASGFRFSYGPGSFARHLGECARLGLARRVLRIRELTWDVDTPADLEGP